MEQKVADHERRIAVMEDTVAGLRDKVIRGDERKQYIERRFDQLEGEVKGINSSIKNLVMVVIVAIIGAVMSFIFKGGLAIVG